MKVSVVISTYNRASRIERMFRSVRELADEIVVVDSGSDSTFEIARSYGARVYRRANNLMLNVNKNYGFTKATGDWILYLDDDEVLPTELVSEIKEAIKAKDVIGFWIPRKNIIFGKWIRHGIWWPDRQLRLFKRGSGKYPEKHVHEYLEVNGKTGVLTSPYIHYNYETLAQYLEKMQVIYTENEVQKYVAAGYRVDWRDAIRFPVSDFLKLYFAQSGYKDGLHGLVLAMLQSFYSFLIFVKLWEREKYRNVDIDVSQSMDELKHVSFEASYWIETTKMRESKQPLARLWHRLLRRVGSFS